MSLEVKVYSNEVHTRSGVSSKTGKPYSIREQSAYLTLPGKPVPVEILVPLGDKQEPYPMGDYQLDASSFYVDRYKSPAIRPVLAPKRAAAPVRAAA